MAKYINKTATIKLNTATVIIKIYTEPECI